MAFAFPGFVCIADYGSVNVDAGSVVEAVGYHFRRGAGAGVVPCVVAVTVAGVAVRGGDDAHDFAVLFQVFVFAGAEVVAEGFAFVDEGYAAGVVGFGLFGCDAAEVADGDVSFCDVEGREVEGVRGAFVFHYYDVGIEVWGVDSADVAGRVAVGGEAVAVVSTAGGGSGVVDDVVVVIFCDSRGRAAGVGEGRVAPPTAWPVAATHEEEEREKWEDPSGSEGCRVKGCD